MYPEYCILRINLDVKLNYHSRGSGEAYSYRVAHGPTSNLNFPSMNKLLISKYNFQLGVNRG